MYLPKYLTNHSVFVLDAQKGFNGHYLCKHYIVGSVVLTKVELPDKAVEVAMLEVEG